MTPDEIVEERVEAAEAGAVVVHVRDPETGEPEMCSANMGSIDFGLYPMLAAREGRDHDWEPEYLEGSRRHPRRSGSSWG